MKITLPSETEQNSISNHIESNNCKNCESPVEGEFCSSCGQRQPQPRLTVGMLFGLMYESLIDFDRGFLFTVKGLFTHPQTVIKDYISGRRIIYTNPIKYLLLWLGISTFIGLSVLDIDKFARQVTESTQKQKPIFKSEEQLRKYKVANAKVFQIQQFIIQNPQFMYAILIPILAVFSDLFFRKQGYTYAEHLLMNTYTMAQNSIVSIPGYFLYAYFPSNILLNSVLSTFLALIYYVVVGTLVFRHASYFGAALRSLLVYVIAYTIFFLLAGIFGFLYMFFSLK